MTLTISKGSEPDTTIWVVRCQLPDSLTKCPKCGSADVAAREPLRIGQRWPMQCENGHNYEIAAADIIGAIK